MLALRRIRRSKFGLTGTRVSGALRIDDTLRQAIIALALRLGIEAS